MSDIYARLHAERDLLPVIAPFCTYREAGLTIQWLLFEQPNGAEVVAVIGSEGFTFSRVTALQIEAELADLTGIHVVAEARDRVRVRCLVLDDDDRVSLRALGDLFALAFGSSRPDEVVGPDPAGDLEAALTRLERQRP